MAFSNLMASLAMLLVLLPLSVKGDSVPPYLSPYFDNNICNEVECGKGSCQAAAGKPFNFVCQCENGWKRTRLDNEEDLQFLPCVIPNCTLDYSCMPAAPPAPAIPYNLSFFDPCYWTYCGEGSCTKNLTYTHICQCNPGYYNLLNVTAFPCFSECALGSDCARLGIKVSNSSSSSVNGNQGCTPNSFCSYGNFAATSYLPGKFHWITILLMSLGMVLWK